MNNDNRQFGATDYCYREWCGKDSEGRRQRELHGWKG